MTRKLQSPTFEQNLASAIQAHQAGQQVQAQALYEAALKQNPRHAHAHYLHGALFWQMGNAQAAIVALEKSAALRVPDLPAHTLMGAVFSALGRYKDAVASFAVVAKATPNSPDAFHNLGRAQRAAKDYGAAIDSFESAIRLKGQTPELLTDLGTVLADSGDKRSAVKVFQDCAARFPSYQPVHSLLAQTLMALGEDADAEAVLKSRLAISPGDHEALLVLGMLHYRLARLQDAENCLLPVIAARPKEPLPPAYLSAVLLAAGRIDEAEHFAKQAYTLDSQNGEILTNYGLVLHARGFLDAAREFHQRAVEANPFLPEAWNNLGITLQQSGRFDEARNCFEKAIELKPQFHGALTNKAQLLLSLGQLSEGWKTYNSRFLQKLQPTKQRSFPYPPLNGKISTSTRLLLWTDQGLGDEVLYASMLQDIRSIVDACMLECTPRLVSLFQRAFPWIHVVPRLNPKCHPAIEEFAPTNQMPLIDLGKVYRPDIDSIPPHCGYLKPDPLLARQFRERYRSIANGKRIIGLSWKSENPNTGQFKSVPLKYWKSVLSQPDVLFVSLQYGDVQPEIAEVFAEIGVEVFQDAAVNARESSECSAAQISAMDLVITTSNTTAHFAGAMNIPTWTLVPSGPGALWYWFLSRSDSPWYPSMTLYRQVRPGEWTGVIASVSSQLERWLVS